ncbi:MAG: DNA polymerase II [Chitinivibrionales bacterium]|nr:DNA polymerase II [Chitinivibrionales bacterium]MBD3395357.1 DNA polymerase II [Chitinivibrionales bacterium]
MSARTARCFLLTHSYRDRSGRLEITLFARAAGGAVVKVVVDSFQPPFFVPRETPADVTRPAAARTGLPLKTMHGARVDCCYFATYRDLQNSAQKLRGRGFRPLESDVHPVERYLMERMVCGGMRVSGSPRDRDGMLVFRNPTVRGDDCDAALHVLSLDIETNAETGSVYSIACDGAARIVFMIGDAPDAGATRYCPDESHVLARFIDHVRAEDPDVLIGWNVLDFDLAVLQKRCLALGIAFDIGREEGARILEPSGEANRHVARIPGRVVLDLPTILRAYHQPFDEYSLDFVAGEVLGEHKDIELSGQAKIDEINRLFREDKEALAGYNLRDAVLTRAVFDACLVLPNAIERSKRSGHLLDRVGGNVAAFDYLYLPRLHREGYVAGDVADVVPPHAPLPGGYVMESTPGIYENVLLLDFRSLYPSIIMTFGIDPLAHAVDGDDRVQGPAGPSFAREKSILPAIIADLMAARGEAKRTGNTSLSQAIKILMNSFYGVLGTTGCRFFSFELASAITGTGQYLLRTTRAQIEQTTPYQVLYGDTDSLFVLLGEGMASRAKETGNQIVARINAWLSQHVKERFDADSALELEFETHFRHFFMPTIRGSSQGSKKRYCGAIDDGGGLRLVFKGLESARSDWTELAKRFQHELFMRVFTGTPVEDYIVRLVDEVRQGAHDNLLVYRKGIRKRLADYAGHAPPHIQAARMLTGRQPSRISYVVTVDGPQPVQMASSPLDYDHYINAQLQPVAESVLEWQGKSFDAILSGQQDLFGGTPET